MSEQHKNLVREFYSELWNRNNKTKLTQILHEDLIFRGSLGDEKRGIEGFTKYVDKVHLALANYHCEILDMVAEGNKVFAKMSFSGIHRNEFMGYKASYQKVSWYGTALFTFKKEKISEIWVLGDLKSLEQQLEKDNQTTSIN